MNLARTDEFEAAYASLRGPAIAAAAAVLRDRTAAEEVAQEAFLELWRRPQSFDRARGTLRTYVCLLARSRALDRARAEATRRRSVERLAALERAAHAKEAGPGDSVEARPLLSAIDSLPRAQREAVLLAYGAGLTHEEIARAVGAPLGTAKSRVRLGLQRLRAESDLSA